MFYDELNDVKCPLCENTVLITGRDAYYALLGENGSACISIRCNNCNLEMFNHEEIRDYGQRKANLISMWQKLDRKREDKSNKSKEISHIKINRSDITDITLLSTEEVERLPHAVRKYSSSWWLRFPGNSPYNNSCATNVSCYGNINYCGSYVTRCDFYCVRPALTINNLKSDNLELYSHVLINGKRFIVIGENTVLYNDKPIYHRFNETVEQGNDYKTSDIKHFVENNFLGCAGIFDDN